MRSRADSGFAWRPLALVVLVGALVTTQGSFATGLSPQAAILPSVDVPPPIINSNVPMPPRPNGPPSGGPAVKPNEREVETAIALRKGLGLRSDDSFDQRSLLSSAQRSLAGLLFQLSTTKSLSSSATKRYLVPPVSWSQISDMMRA